MSKQHSHHHHHSHDHEGPVPLGPMARRAVIAILAAVGVFVAIGAAVLWPNSQRVAIPLPMQSSAGGAMHTEAGSVIDQNVGPCGSPSNGQAFQGDPAPAPPGSYTCNRSIVDIESGPSKGTRTLLEIPPGPDQPKLHAGDHVRLAAQTNDSGTTLYSFEDYARGVPLTLITIIFLAVIVVVARWRGLRALIGLVIALAVIVFFVLPALLEGKPALPVAMVAGVTILYAVLYLAHGVNYRTSAALLGTLSAMLVAAVLSSLTITITNLTGLSEEQNTNVATYLQHVSITGLLLAGFIIGSIGVLNDVTVTQASTAFELAHLDRKANRRTIFAAAMRVGRDHIASTVYTLVFAYAGGALPTLLLFSVAGRSMSDVLTGDAVAIELVRSAIGGIALALSVPLTTAIAVLLARPLGTDNERPDVHRHAPSSNTVPGRTPQGPSPAARGPRPTQRPMQPQRYGPPPQQRHPIPPQPQHRYRAGA